MINDYTDRHYPFEGCFNFRDIGGYLNNDGKKVKKGLYFRAGRQDRMSDMDLSKLSDLKISTQIDLRKPDEVLDQGRGPLEAMGAKYINIAVIPEGGSDQLSRLVGDTGISGKRYLGYLEFGPTSWLRLFGILADKANLPVVLHCTAGKDRTGVSTAFLLSILGVSRDVIEEDYLITNLDNIYFQKTGKARPSPFFYLLILSGNKMQTICVTGGIAMGKTTVMNKLSEIFSEFIIFLKSFRSFLLNFFN